MGINVFDNLDTFPPPSPCQIGDISGVKYLIVWRVVSTFNSA